MDNFKHKGMRKKLVTQLEEKGIQDINILDAIGNIPRHLFMDSGFVQFAYQDKAFPIGAGQTISQPYTVAFQTELLQIQKNHKVLEIGTGSGYQAAVLVELGVNLFTIERQRPLFVKAQEILTTLEYHPRFYFGDGYLGLPGYAPFDRIIITAGANQIPEKLVEQLAKGGRMVIPIGNQEGQKMILIEKDDKGNVARSEHGDFAFVPMLKGTNN